MALPAGSSSFQAHYVHYRPPFAPGRPDLNPYQDTPVPAQSKYRGNPPHVGGGGLVPPLPHALSGQVPSSERAPHDDLGMSTSHLTHFRSTVPIEGTTIQHGLLDSGIQYAVAPAMQQAGSLVQPQQWAPRTDDNGIISSSHSASNTGTTNQRPSQGEGNTIKKPMRAQQACEQCRVKKQKCTEGRPCVFCEKLGLDCKYGNAPPPRSDPRLESIDDRLEMLERQVVKLERQVVKLEAKVVYQDTLLMQCEARSQISHHELHHLLLWPSIRALFTPDELQRAGCNVAGDYYAGNMFVRGEESHRVAEPRAILEASDRVAQPGMTANTHSHKRRLGRSPVLVDDAELENLAHNGDGLKDLLNLHKTAIRSLFELYLKHFHWMHPFIDVASSRKMLETFVAKYSSDAVAVMPDSSASIPSVTHSDNDSTDGRARKRLRTPTGYARSSSSRQEDQTMGACSTERSSEIPFMLIILALGATCQEGTPLSRYGCSGQRLDRRCAQHAGKGDGSRCGRASKATYDDRPSTSALKAPLCSSNSSTLGEEVSSAPGMSYFAKAIELLSRENERVDLMHAQTYLLAGLYTSQLVRQEESLHWYERAGEICRTLVEDHNLYQPGVFMDPDSHIMLSDEDVIKAYESIVCKTSQGLNAYIIITAWSGLLLLSCILRGLNRQRQNICEIEGSLLPAYTAVTNNSDHVDSSNGADLLHHRYWAHIFLGRQRDQLCWSPYGTANGRDPQRIAAYMKERESQLSDWRCRSLAPQLGWQDDDELPTDIPTARLRENYYTTLYISRRPYLDFLLHTYGDREGSVPLNALGRPRSSAERLVLQAIGHMSMEDVAQRAKEGVQAAIKSVLALDNAGCESRDGVWCSGSPRLIVDNIHDTAHA